MEVEALVVYAANEPMRGIVCPGPHQTYRHPRVVREKRTRGALLPQCIRVEMLYAGVCGTDLHLTQEDEATGYIKTSCPTVLPPEGRVFGHEGVGRVLEVGAEVRNLAPGALVAFESIEVCHYCERCRQGRFNQCRHSRLLGMESDGLFASVADVPASLAHDVTDLVRDDRDAQALACLEPAGVALVACQNAGIKPGQNVVIFGAGPIGVYCAMLARTLFSAASVRVVEPQIFRREFAARWADAVYSPEEFFASATDEVDAVIEASGCMENLDRVLPRVNANGRLVMLARSGEPLSLSATDHMITNAISLSGSRGHLCGAFHTLLNLYRENLFHPGRIVTDVVDGLGALADLLATPERMCAQSCKVLVRLRAFGAPVGPEGAARS